MTPAQLHTQMDLSPKNTDITSTTSLPALLREQVALRPNDIAVTSKGTCLTFRELDTASHQLAIYLQSLAVQADECVGIYVEPSVDLMIGVWGILQAGAAYLPLSPDYPEERIRYMIENARLRVVYVQSHLKDRLSNMLPPNIRVIVPEEVPTYHAANPPTLPPLPSPHPDTLAYVIYTSGSTGKPKGVMIAHRSIVNQMRWLQATFGLGSEQVVLQKTPMSFDAAQWEILAVACGAQVVMGEPGLYRDPEGLIATISHYQVTTLQCVPTLLQALLDNEDFGHCTSLSRVFCGGEALPRALAKQCLQTLPHSALINLYGPTECTINTSSFTVVPEQCDVGPAAIAIGHPVSGTDYYILREDKCTQVAQGETGELYIGGIQLARGYLHRPDLTAERFIDSPFVQGERLYRTGDLATWNDDGGVQFAGRADQQVKLRGFRVELDEIRLAIKSHDWVKNAAVLIRNDERTGAQNLVACIELSPREAALMDQGNHGAHHLSKNSRLQVRAQLSNPGCRDTASLANRPTIALPCQDAPAEIRRRVFARKTYRFFEGGEVMPADIERLLAPQRKSFSPRAPETLTLEELGEILRYFSQHLSEERLLPKYGYASPGALYAAQMYFELDQIAGLPSGYYYYHPVSHALTLIEAREGREHRLRLHFTGKRSGIEPVYKNNIQEVLEIETGHMLGLFDEVLPVYGLAIGASAFIPQTLARLDCADDDYYLGSFDWIPYSTEEDDSVDIYIQIHPGRVNGLAAGQYRLREGKWEQVSDQLILKKHVIAINQQVYERASFGLSFVSRHRNDWMQYIALGRKLQRLQMNDLALGFMSSGYSSKSGHDLPAARRIQDILTHSGERVGPYYFCVAGKVSAEQLASEGMKEDAIHMKGPAELIREDLLNLLPDYMMPNKIVIMPALPQTANGKIDHKMLERLELTAIGSADRPFVAPRSASETQVADIWCQIMKWDAVSVMDDFFECGGNSLMAVALINRINRSLACTLPIQTIFEAPTVERLAQRIDSAHRPPVSRLVPLAKGGGTPIFCWPGLGGYPMNLRALATQASNGRPFFGVQAYGLNPGEKPYETIAQMAAADVRALREIQTTGPYTLWGYSFGARVAFEAAYQLEQAGEQVESVRLIAPGSPKVRMADAKRYGQTPDYNNPAFVTILFSVFAHAIDDPALTDCLREVHNEADFANFICNRYRNLDRDLVARIIRIASQTYEFRYTFQELAQRQLSAPLTIFKAEGDDYSFLESQTHYSQVPPTEITLQADHYSLLKPSGIGELAQHLRTPEKTQKSTPDLFQSPFNNIRIQKEDIMPHLSIKHFPIALSEEKKASLVASLTQAMEQAFGCSEDVISIALEPVQPEAWRELVYIPEINQKQEFLCKQPNY